MRAILVIQLEIPLSVALDELGRRQSENDHAGRLRDRLSAVIEWSAFSAPAGGYQ
jgi:hypothetical protein